MPRRRSPWRLVLALLVLAAVGAGVAAAVAGRSGETGSASAPDGPTGTAPGTPSASPSTTPAPPPPPLAGRTVVLDPGHNRDNGRHPGQINRQVDAGGFAKACNTTGTATNSGVPEATVNWELAQEVRVRLEALGARVVLTRQEDAGWGPCIDERAAVANREGAALLLSLHADGVAPGAHGFHVIHPGLRPGWTDDIVVASGQAAVAVRDALVAGGLTPATYTGSEGLDERSDLGTLNNADVPAVMLEAGNLRHAGDAALLTDPAGRARIADALAVAVSRFLAG
ncbi:N-acetylmuramoyl-L-alanine amidase [Candidatus Blastococcus massiliensis]|uniref:N-acetylmuramoyl-L-alanine amidase n=1 Tax=Candidatus Blastococcus massiliensis TaxID=1470358 RepID=UPI0004AE86BA|nr:N-acetylmuramoyl-L-alanine amidase [Candidatus Blastococcus massiliensis]